MTSRGLLFSALILAAAVGSGCSLERKNMGSGLKVKLLPMSSNITSKFRKTTAQNAMASIMSGSFLWYDSTLTDFEDLNCFSVSVRGEGIGDGEVCGGVRIGDYSGTVEGIDVEFDFDIPVLGKLTFDAYGSQASFGCSEMLFDTDSIFKIGEVSVEAGALGEDAEITIPVGLNSTSSYQCTDEAAVTLADNFDYYPDGNLDGNGHWYAAVNDAPIASGSIDTSIISGDHAHVLQKPVSASKLFTRISMVSYTESTLGSPGGTQFPAIVLGLTDKTTPSTATGFSCYFQFQDSETSMKLIGDKFVVATTFTPNPAGLVGPTTVSDLVYLVCDIVREPSGVTVTARVFDLYGSEEAAEETTGLPQNNGAIYPFFRTEGSGAAGYGSGAFIDGFIVEQSDSYQ